MSTKRKSGTSPRRSLQGSPMPGNPSPSPPKVRLRNSVCISRDSRVASVSRLRSALVRWLGRMPCWPNCGVAGPDSSACASVTPSESKPAPPSVPGARRWRSEARRRAQRCHRSHGSTGHDHACASRRCLRNPFRPLPDPHPPSQGWILAVPSPVPTHPRNRSTAHGEPGALRPCRSASPCPWRKHRPAQPAIPSAGPRQPCQAGVAG